MTPAASRALLRWYAPRSSLYPWRRRPTPYRVLVSEVMLQQTQASRVVPAYRSFVRRFPTASALAAAPRSEVVRAWAGLGYNRRAVALSEAARAIVRRHRGRVPPDLDALLGLAGVGPYTASAVAAIAFGAPAAAVDTNVRRVVARWSLGVEPEEASADAVRRAATRALDGHDPASWNQAVMDLGREVCRPVPRCGACPIAAGCRSRGAPRPMRTAPRGGSPFEGSSRQLRGRIVSALRKSSAVTIGELVEVVGAPGPDVAAAVRTLGRDGLVSSARGGRVRLAP